MKLPKRFQLMGRKIEVVERVDLLQDRDWTGAAVYSQDKIELLPTSEIYVRSQAAVEQTFFHELVHHLLYHAGGAINHDLKSGGYLHKNEEFVDLLGSLLHQAVTSAEYD